jgi:hypothetical protein
MFGRGFKRYLEKRDEEFRVWAQERDEAFKAWTRDREKKSEELREEDREFNREILLRNEKVYTSMIVQMEENTEQIRANTQAVLTVLDRLNGSSA